MKILLVFICCIEFLLINQNNLYAQERNKTGLIWNLTIYEADIGLLQASQKDEFPYIIGAEVLNIMALFENNNYGLGITLSKMYLNTRRNNNTLINIYSMHRNVLYLYYFPYNKSLIYDSKCNNHFYVGSEFNGEIKMDLGYSLSLRKYLKLKIGYIAFQGRIENDYISNQIYCMLSGYIDTRNIGKK